MTEEQFQKIWKPVKLVIEYCKLEYDEAVTIGGQFGELKKIILEQKEKIEELESLLENKVIIDKQEYEYLQENSKLYERLKAYGVNNWGSYYEAINDTEGYFEDD